MEYFKSQEYSIDSVELVLCLSIDLIGSTEAGFELSTQKLDRFNIALVDQIRPHLEKLELTDVVLKFTGDGWLVMTEKPKRASALCCLATIMANRFQEEMSQKTGIAVDKIPSLRIAISLGRDISVKLPDGRKDWVGDSARRSMRISGYCFPNEILIDEPVRYIVFRDFDIKSVDIKRRSLRHQPKKMEEEFLPYTLGELKTETVVGSEAPEYFVYTLGIIGKLKEAKTVAQQVSKHLEYEVSKPGIAEEDIEKILRSLNRLMASVPDYRIALNIMKSIRNAGLAPNIVTYNTHLLTRRLIMRLQKLGLSRCA